MENNIASSLKSRRGLLIIIVAALLLELISAIQYYYAHSLLEGELEQRVLTELKVKTFMMRQTLNSAEQTLQEHLWDIQNNLDNAEYMFAATRRLMEKNDKIVGSCMAFVPYYYPEKGRLFEPYAYENGDSISVTQLGGQEHHDYTQHPAYKQAVARRTPVWSDPYEYSSANGIQSLTSYSYPVTDSSGRVAAVCGLDVSLEWLGETLNAHHLYPSSFGLFLTESGELIAGSTDVCDKRQQHIVDLLNNKSVSRETLDDGHIRAIEFYDSIIGDKGYIYSTYMEEPRWQVALVCYDDEVYGKLDAMRLYIMLLMLLGFILLGYMVMRYMQGMFHLHEVDMEKKRISSELHIAKEIQMQMLPKIFPPYPERTDVDIFGSLVAAREVGGDLFDFFIRDEKLFFCIGDVSGKGVPSAMVMAQTLSQFRAFSTHENNPARIMQSINEAACQGNDSNMFVTLFIGVLDLPSGLLRYCDAGHDAPLIYENGTWVKEECKPNLPVGIFEDIQYCVQETSIAPGSTLFLYTDGLTEAKNNERKQFGLQRTEEALNKYVAEAAEAHEAMTANALIEAVTAAVHGFVKEAEQSDDLTLMAISYTPQDFQSLLSETLTLTNDVHEVLRLSTFQKAYYEKITQNASLARQLRLAVEEAVVNVIDYAYPLGTDGTIEINMMWDGHQLKVIVTDSGIPFDPTSTAPADTTLSAEERQIGGLGIHLVREIMDTINYERVKGHNVLTMIKRIES